MKNNITRAALIAAIIAAAGMTGPARVYAQTGAAAGTGRNAQKSPFGIMPVKSLHPAQLERIKFDAEHQVKLEFDPITLKGTPEHSLRDLHLTLYLGSPEESPEVARARIELQDFLIKYLAEKTYFDMNRLSEKMRLRETILLFFREQLNRAVVCEVFITNYKLI